MNKLKHMRFTGKRQFYKSFDYQLEKLFGLRRVHTAIYATAVVYSDNIPMRVNINLETREATICK